MTEKLIKKMFGTTEWPMIDFGLSNIPGQAQKLTGKLSISGVQPKLVMRLNKEKNQLESMPGGDYILKPQTDRFLNIPENEQCCMDIAEALNIDTPPHCLLPLKDGTLAYVIKRFDRHHGEKIHQEEFSQLLGEDDKYKGSVEQIGKKIREVSTAPGYDLQLFFERVVLNFIIANGDAHLKNYTMRYFDDERRLAPAYDIVCSRIAIANEREESAISISGKQNNLTRHDFDILADYLKTTVKVRYKNFEDKFNIIENIIGSSKLPKEDQDNFRGIVKERLTRLNLPL
ncbi:MAG: HipA domain-containing protein [Candidatus Omnitrophica bacterium]|nr:HipA domain-containing protein [Candidatus Omnitrophota bacterium]